MVTPEVKSRPSSTPDHPAYAEMIQAAIRALAEEDGSTAEAIDQYIKSEYHELPFGHHNLFPHYIRKLIAAGDIHMSPSTRLLIPNPPQGTTLPSENSTANPMVEDSQPLPPNEPVAAQVPPPESPISAAQMGHVRPAPSDPAAEPPPAPLSSGGVVSPSLPKRRGRPPKKTMIAQPVLPEVETKMMTSLPVDNSSSSAAPKRRGRPPKKNMIAPDVLPEVETTALPPVDKSSSSSVVLKRRGRPPKKKPEVEEQAATTNVDVVSEKEELVASQAAKTSSSALPKRRGRPPKKPRLEDAPSDGPVVVEVPPAESVTTVSRPFAPPTSQVLLPPPDEPVADEVPPLESVAVVSPPSASPMAQVPLMPLSDPAAAPPTLTRCRVGSPSLSKRRGRPPKQQKLITAAHLTGPISDDLEMTSHQMCQEFPPLPPTQMQTVALSTSNVVPRKRGRPPKKKLIVENGPEQFSSQVLPSTIPEEQAIVNGNELMNLEAPLASLLPPSPRPPRKTTATVPKPRGNPPRKKQAVLDGNVNAGVVSEPKSAASSIGELSSSPMAKRRGRPPKKNMIAQPVLPEVETKMTTSPAVNNSNSFAKPKRRGRPWKKNTIAQDVLPELPAGDNSSSSAAPKHRGRPPNNTIAQNVLPESPAIDNSSSSATPKRRGRPPKKSTIAQDVLPEVGTAALPPVDKSSSSATPKHRGRPPKKKPEVGEQAATTNVDVVSEKEELAASQAPKTSSSAVPKRRGRPPKKPRLEDGAAPNVGVLSDHVIALSSTGAVPKRRGRPSKKTEDVTNNGGGGVDRVSEEKGGFDAAAVASIENKSTSEQVRRGRGRPPKKKSIAAI